VLPWVLRRRLLPPKLSSFVLTCAAGSGLLFTFLTTSWYTAQRYLIDFQPVWLLISVTALMAYVRSAPPSWFRASMLVGAGLASILSVCVGMIGTLHGPYGVAVRWLFDP
jgi:hypothetical protein